MPDEYISRRAAIKAVCDCSAHTCKMDECFNGCTEAKALSSIPAADVVERPCWIPVTERLPEPFTRVIGFMAWKAITAVEYQHNNWYSIDHLEPLPREAVTHWMPLPEPPKEEA